MAKFGWLFHCWGQITGRMRKAVGNLDIAFTCAKTIKSWNRDLSMGFKEVTWGAPCPAGVTTSAVFCLGSCSWMSAWCSRWWSWAQHLSPGCCHTRYDMGRACPRPPAVTLAEEDESCEALPRPQFNPHQQMLGLLWAAPKSGSFSEANTNFCATTITSEAETRHTRRPDCYGH